MTDWLVLRPEPGASATAEAIALLGRNPVKAPLFTVHILDFAALHAAQHDALLLTSANAARALAGKLGPWLTMPVYAVGAATAAAARALGIRVIHTGEKDAASLVRQAAEDGYRRLIHLTGREHRVVDQPGVTIDRRIVYAADAVTVLPDAARVALAAGALALLHSPRAAGLFAELIDAAGIDRGATAIAALSPAVAEAAGIGWWTVAVADAPTDQALLAAAGRLCDRVARKG